MLPATDGIVAVVKSEISERIAIKRRVTPRTEAIASFVNTSFGLCPYGTAAVI